MDVQILKQGKNSVELSIDNLTIAEIVRVYLNNQGIEFAAWRREHPSKPLLFKIDAGDKTVKKAVSDAIEAIKKDCSKIVSALKK